MVAASRRSPGATFFGGAASEETFLLNPDQANVRMPDRMVFRCKRHSFLSFLSEGEVGGLVGGRRRTTKSTQSSARPLHEYDRVLITRCHLITTLLCCLLSLGAVLKNNTLLVSNDCFFLVDRGWSHGHARGSQGHGKYALHDGVPDAAHDWNGGHHLYATVLPARIQRHRRPSLSGSRRLACTLRQHCLGGATPTCVCMCVCVCVGVRE